jgi:hypothetical protein
VTDFHGYEKKKKKLNLGFGTWWIQKMLFFKSTNSQYLSPKFQGLNLGKIGEIDWCGSAYMIFFKSIKSQVQKFKNSKLNFFSFISIKVSHKLWGSMDYHHGLWFPAKN